VLSAKVKNMFIKAQFDCLAAEFFLKNLLI
jgi:hypothetical protein